jgi:hypothetical protein
LVDQAPSRLTARLQRASSSRSIALPLNVSANVTYLARKLVRDESSKSWEGYCIPKKLTRVCTVVTDDRNRACLHALFVTNPLDDMIKVQDDKNKLVHGTCSWILGDPVYTKWLNEDRSQILWIHGDPGKGKTMLTIFLRAYYISFYVKGPSYLPTSKMNMINRRISSFHLPTPFKRCGGY